MRFIGEGRRAGPGQALAAHVAVEVGLRVGEAGHVVAADAGQGARALRQAGRGVVRATGAEERLAHLLGAQGHRRHARRRDPVQVAVHALHVRPRRQAVGDGQRDLRHRQRAELREQGVALLVDLADHLRLGVGGQVVESGAGLVFQQRALVLDHHQRLQAAGEGAQAGGLQRPGHADLIEGDARGRRPRRGDIPIAARASMTSAQAWPWAAMPSRGAVRRSTCGRGHWRGRRPARRAACAAAAAAPCPSAGPSAGCRRPPDGRGKFSGSTNAPRSGPTWMVAPESMVSARAISPTHRPEKRDRP